jgi:hypothetical protein
MRYTRRSIYLGLIGLSLIGTTLWAVIVIPAYFRVSEMNASSLQPPLPLVRRDAVPNVLAWFFVQFPYVSPDASITEKSHHTFVITDQERRREYAVILGQSFRRVEIYYSDHPEECQVQVFTPGRKRVVWMRGGVVERDGEMAQRNDWMWLEPLWNPLHMKIFAMADLWKDSRYPRYSCARFVHEFLRNAGISMPLLDAWDVAKLRWNEVSLSELEPGDVVTLRAPSEAHRRFWHHSITHVGIYLGNGMVIHASTPSRQAHFAVVKVSSVEDLRPLIHKVLRPPELL